MPRTIRRVQMADERLPGLGESVLLGREIGEFGARPGGQRLPRRPGLALGNGGATTRKSADYSGGNSRRERIRG